ncbi:MAG: glycosyltransferase, partial [Alphaproteobacteria bacterium]
GRAISRHLADRAVDVVHGHGAKGGAYARLVGGSRLKVYTPHGGSLHYSRSTPVGFVYLTLEQVLSGRTDLFLFESQYGLDTFRSKVCEPKGTVKVVHNGVSDEEFVPVPQASDATDLLFVGELRALKGVDVLIAAIAQLKAAGRSVTATLVGAGPDAESFKAQVTSAGLADQIRFPGALPARQAFAMGRVMVVPSRAESLPYVVLEAGAAGLPVIATAVGGIGEIFGPDRNLLIPADDAGALAKAITRQLTDAEPSLEAAARLKARIGAEFSVTVMTDGVLSAYGEALAAR